MPERWREFTASEDPSGLLADEPDFAEPVRYGDGELQGIHLVFPFKRFGGSFDVMVPMGMAGVVATLIFGPNILP